MPHNTNRRDGTMIALNGFEELKRTRINAVKNPSLNTIRFGRFMMRNKQGSVAVLMFVLVIALVHLGIPQLMAQEIAPSTSGGTASQSVNAIGNERHARLVAFGTPLAEGIKLDMPVGAMAPQVLPRPEDGTVTSLNDGDVKNDRCDCEDRFFPASGIEIPSIK
jgi:hypothetical protein